MLEEKKTFLNKNVLLNIWKNQRTKAENEKTKRLFLLLGVLLSLSLIAAIYFLSDISSIYRITVYGNYYLSAEDIIKQSQLTTSDKYLLSFPYLIEKRLKENQLIDECEVKLLNDRIVSINVKEKKIIGYAYEDNENVLILADDGRIILDKDSVYLINKVPLIEGFLKDDIVLIEKNLADCDSRIINEISEIHNYPLLKYQNVELIMRDGNYIFTSVYGLNILNRYYDIASSYVSEEKLCYYFEDISKRAFTKACPWQESKENNDVNITDDNDIDDTDE